MKQGFIFIFLSIVYFIPIKSNASVYVNEVAWMGNSSNSNAEWIELYNDGLEDEDISSWSISGSVSISIPEGKSIVAGGFFLFERTSDDTVPQITADHIYTGALSNTGGSIVLKNKDGSTVDELSFSSGWPAGDNTTKDTMQKLNGSWYTANPTPKAHTQADAVNNNTNNSSSSLSSSSSSSSNTNNTNTSTNTNTTSNIKASSYREMKIKIIARQKNIPSGVPQNFSVEVYGHYGEKLERGNVVWNFGDGKILEAASFETVSHKYKHTGEYVISVQYFTNAKDKEGDLEDKIDIKVVSAELAISNIGTADNPYIEIENKSSYEVSLKDWHLIAGGKIFVFPPGTYIKSGRKNIFDAEFLGFSSSDLSLIVLMRPGFEIESTFPESFSNTNVYINTNKVYSKNNIVNSKKEKSSNFEDNTIIDLDSIISSSQEASAIKSIPKISAVFLLVFVMAVSISTLLFFRKRKVTDKFPDIKSLSSSDIKIIE